MRRALLALALLLPGVAVGAQNVRSLPAFDVASIKIRTTPGDGPAQSPDRYTRTNVSLRDLIGDAYRLQRFEIVGGPDWGTGSVRFDVSAKASSIPSPEQMRLMVRRLLAERFAVRVHKETREMPVYVLRLSRADGRLGKQLNKTSVDCVATEAERKRTGERPSPAQADASPVCGSFLRARPGAGGITLRYQASGTSSGELASWLSPYVTRTVIDRTGLTGALDLDLAFNPAAPVTSTPLGDEAVSVFTALQEQLGLKLDSSKEPVDVLVIDDAQLPTPD